MGVNGSLVRGWFSDELGVSTYWGWNSWGSSLVSYLHGVCLPIILFHNSFFLHIVSRVAAKGC